ncbi:bifunctional folylpolyglutamate synthase/dihydrofolate synthase [Paucilactobacillus nenjiangensis]|jgi:dihydrofolate synthase/folylpolyglutamate synthase|uniref:tetrahydrofolate synthase n=1 Tax=Paucilactobacillus nenjiangensis TaxID=1296540 RepID=A0A5P1X1R2_9LACO|nr:folylpolyglutamate synthase/dihydrofolate synthase family protein [Paucilactobacillus nenjiangensis]QER67850.1 bifunctional folylpolyglutamate synthase/dihydrofolate synthase [Paucilactobacillus nenjiangensis]
MIKNYEEALSFIHGRQKFKKIPILDRMSRLMAQLGNPQDSLKMVHVTGTNGKGSTVAYLTSILLEQGLSVGTFTSPFITRFNERVSLNRNPISNEALLKIVQEIEPIILDMDQADIDGGPTEFEIVTALMFMYFGQIQPDIVIVEVGIGGTYDSTNIILPILSIITTVGMDHMQILGDTLSEIADQKAGIIKPKIPVVLGNVPDEARLVIETVANKSQSELSEWQKDYQVVTNKRTSIYPQYTFRSGRIKMQLELSMVGEFQIQNSAIAIQSFLKLSQVLTMVPSIKSMKKAIKETRWPGRMELINEQPAIFIDGAHNVPAIDALITTIETDFSQQQVYLIVAILADKQAKKMVDKLLRLPNVKVILTSFAAPYKQRPSIDTTDISEHSTKFDTVDSWQDGLVKVTQEMSSDDILIFTGSLYFISEVRNYFH